MEFYRYEWREYASMYDDEESYYRIPSPNPKVELYIYNLIKETEKGYWISYYQNWMGDEKRWVSKTAKKRFAYPTKEEALEGFIKRTQKRQQIHQHQVDCCQIALGRTKDIEYKLKQENEKIG